MTQISLRQNTSKLLINNVWINRKVAFHCKIVLDPSCLLINNPRLVPIWVQVSHLHLPIFTWLAYEYSWYHSITFKNCHCTLWLITHQFYLLTTIFVSSLFRYSLRIEGLSLDRHWCKAIAERCWITEEIWLILSWEVCKDLHLFLRIS